MRKFFLEKIKTIFSICVHVQTKSEEEACLVSCMYFAYYLCFLPTSLGTPCLLFGAFIMVPSLSLYIRLQFPLSSALRGACVILIIHQKF